MAAHELNNTILKNSSALKAYYRFESGALTTDSSGNDKTLTDTGTVGEGTGVYGGAADFGTSNTTKHYKRTPDVLTYTDIGTAFAVNVWVNGSSFAAERKVLRYILNNGTLERNFELIVDTSSHAVFKTFDGTSRAVTGTSTIATSTWTMLTIVYDGSAMRLYVNGNSEGTPVAFSWSGYSRTTYSNFSIGAEQLTSGGGVSAYWQGLLDEFAIFSSALSADQIKELYEGRFIGEAWPQSGLVAGFHLSSTTDFGPYNGHLTNNNSVGFVAGKFGNCADFGTTNTNKSLSLAAGYAITTNVLSLSIWVKMRTEIGSGTQEFCLHGNDTTDVDYLLQYDYNGGTRKVNFIRYKENVGADGTAPTYVITLGTSQWHHIVGTCDGTTAKIYVDGNLGSTLTIGANGTGGANITRCGGSAGFGWASAYLDEFLIFNRALTASEIRRMYAVGTGKYY